MWGMSRICCVVSRAEIGWWWWWWWYVCVWDEWGGFLNSLLLCGNVVVLCVWTRRGGVSVSIT
jgi:hypothetical protein